MALTLINRLTKSIRILFLQGFLLCFYNQVHADQLPAPSLQLSSKGLNVTASWSTVNAATGYRIVYAPYPYNNEPLGYLDIADNTTTPLIFHLARLIT